MASGDDHPIFGSPFGVLLRNVFDLGFRVLELFSKRTILFTNTKNPYFYFKYFLTSILKINRLLSGHFAALWLNRSTTQTPATREGTQTNSNPHQSGLALGKDMGISARKAW